MNLWRTLFFSMILPFPPKYSLNFPSLPEYFFLPAHARIFPWAGKNKSGSETEKMEPNLLKILDR